MTTEGQKIFTMTVILKVSALTGILFGLMLALMISMMRSSSRFWKYSEEVAKLINEAETKDALKGIYKNEFSKLREMMGGRPHLEEVKRLYAILETKHKYIKC
jgi:MFS superfamily sulfate permease-like transporter